MAEPTEAPAGLPKARRRIFQCSECDEVFVDEESLKRHELTHKPAPTTDESGGDDDAPPAPAPRGRPPVRENSSVAAPPPRPGARGAAAGPTSEVREQAGIEPPGDLLSGGLGPSALDAQISHLDVDRNGLGPMSWEDRPARGNVFKSVYTLVEDFSEFLFSGLQKAFGAVGLTLVPAIGLALKAIIVLALSGALLMTGMYVGRRVGPKLLSRPVNQPKITPGLPAAMNADDDLSQARAAVTDFYAAIDRGSYNDAYDLLSPAWKRALDYEAFESGYRSTRAVRCKVDHTRQVGEDIEVDFSLVVDEQGQKKKVSGTYLLIHSSDGWKLDSGSMRD